MDVRSVFLDCFSQNSIDETDDWRIVVTLQQVRRFWQLLCDLQQIGMFVEITDHLHRHLAALLVRLLQHSVKGFCGNADQIERHADEATGFS